MFVLVLLVSRVFVCSGVFVFSVFFLVCLMYRDVFSLDMLVFVIVLLLSWCVLYSRDVGFCFPVICLLFNFTRCALMVLLFYLVLLFMFLVFWLSLVLMCSRVCFPVVVFCSRVCVCFLVFVVSSCVVPFLVLFVFSSCVCSFLLLWFSRDVFSSSGAFRFSCFCLWSVWFLVMFCNISGGFVFS